MAVGTPAYMSPEQASGGQVDARSDIYALGCVLYEMLAGEAPYTGPTPQAILAKRVLEPVPHVRTLRESVPEGAPRPEKPSWLQKQPARLLGRAAGAGAERPGSSLERWLAGLGERRLHARPVAPSNRSGVRAVQRQRRLLAGSWRRFRNF
jgi:serine/threonine protein kinase